MRLDRHEICGFFHFDQPFVLPLAELPPGLVAMTGPNGSGKSGCGMDGPLAGVYGPGLAGSTPRAFPSRDGTLANYATSRKAYIDDLWTLEGRGQFRLRVGVDGKQRTVDASIEQVLADGTRKLLNDGKVTTFKDVVKDLFPSRRSVLASAFAAQNKRGSFGELGEKERMELFVEYADLAHYQQRAETALRCAKVADGIAARLRSALDVLRRDASTETEMQLSERLARCVHELAQAAEAAVKSEQDVERLDGARRTQAEAVAAHAVALSRVRALQAAFATAEAALTARREAEPRLRQEHARLLGQVEARHTQVTAGIAARRGAALRAHEAKLADLRQRLANNRKLLTQAETIRAAVSRSTAAETQVAGWQTEQVQASTRRDEASEQMRVRQDTLKDAEHAGKELETVRARARMLTVVKFGDECGVAPACPLVTDAVAARDRIADLEGQAAHVGSLRDGLAHWQAQWQAATADLARLMNAITAAQRALAADRILAAKASYLDAAEQRIAEYEADIGQADATHVSVLAALAEETAMATAARDTERAAADTAHRLALGEHALATALDERAVTEADASLRQAQEDAALTSDAKAEADRIDVALRQAQTARVVAESTRSRLASEQQALLQRQEALARARTDIVEAERRQRVVEDEGLAWRTLAEACGRDGLQRLEIDAAGPVVSDLANQLLLVGWGPRFSVQIVTQVATADGKDTKEKFTVLVRDEEHGGESRDIGDLSGGEGVVVTEAIRAALSCYVNLRSRQPCRTIFRDEADGGLSVEAGPAYVAMLQKLRELSGAVHLIFITHRPDLAALADVQVRVDLGQATVVLPPFEAAA